MLMTVPLLVIPGESVCETRDTVIFHGAVVVGHGSPLRFGRDDNRGTR